MTAKPESLLVGRILRRLHEEHSGSFFFKVHGGPFQKRGLPDIIGCLKMDCFCGQERGVFVGLEVKQPGGSHTATDLQAHTLKKIDQAGGVSGLVTSYEDVARILADYEQREP